MADFKINLFGSLTSKKTGEVLKFEDFDTDKDGKISENEYAKIRKQIAKTDRVELSTVDKDEDKEVSKEEFATWQQEIEMQNAVNLSVPLTCEVNSGKNLADCK